MFHRARTNPARNNTLSIGIERLRKMPGIAITSTRGSDTLGTDYILRACALRKQGRIGIVLVSSGHYYLATNPADPWGNHNAASSPEPISHDNLRALIDRIDAETTTEANAA